ncbi:MAG: hypothetical protein K1X72_18110 [Pyrinomonadaceae bacterium]|nr:hypothetical protein [Pyrinomonadaceae bacterium]
MFRNLNKVFWLFGLILFSFSLAFAQSETEKEDPSKKLDLPETLQETLQKRRIKEEEKEFQELIKNGEEAVKISEEVSKNFDQTKKISSEDQKKLEKLEKLVKKIRQELGAEEDKEKTEDDSPSSLSAAINNLKSKSLNLLDELKKRTKFSISVVAVESSNSIWKLIKFLKLSRN